MIERLETRIAFDAGDFDTAFGTNGTAIVDLAPLINDANAGGVSTDFAEDLNGYILLVARKRTQQPTEQFTYVARLRPGGALDPTFGVNGIQTIPAVDGSSPQVGTDSLGRVYVYDEGGAIVRRLTSRGKLDASFGNRGKAKIPYLTRGQNELAVDPEGHAYIFGSEWIGEDNDIAVLMGAVRLTVGGKLDTDWADDGAFRPSLPAGDQEAAHRGGRLSQIQFLNGGKVMFGGYGDFTKPESSQGSSYQIAARLNADGTPDETYGEDGFNVARKDSTSKKAYGFRPILFLSDGSLLSWEQETFIDTNPKEMTFYNIRVPADGKSIEIVDLLTPAAESALDIERLENAVVQRDGKYITDLRDGELARIDTLGNVDTSWSDDGIVPASEFGPVLVVSRGGALLVQDDPQPRNQTIGVSRYWSDDRPTAIGSAKEMTESQSGSRLIRVTWRDDDGLAQNSFSTGDVVVELPNGTRRSVKFHSASTNPDGSVETVYKLTATDGVWGSDDNGTYRILTRTGEVLDTNGLGNRGEEVGSFRVNIV